jgi:ATP-dependent protease Clp ATPase subunit
MPLITFAAYFTMIAAPLILLMHGLAWGLVLVLVGLYAGRRDSWIQWTVYHLIGGAAATPLGRMFHQMAFLVPVTVAGKGPELIAGAIRGSESLANGLGGVLITAAVPVALYYIAKERFMPSIFDIASDRAALETFAQEGKPRQRPQLPEIDPARLAELVRQDVIGQDAIVADVTALLARRVRQQRQGRPLGVVLFVGATGAGKTELAKALAKHAFEGRLTRVDCNELTESHSAQRLIGAPPGYIGSEQGGQLTRDIERLGSGVILFDEVEKAHEAVLRIIMGLLDEGRLTEASTGRVADASQFFIVLTSNAEHQKLAELVEQVTDPDERRRAVKDTLQSVFRPEQLARIDEIHAFGPLDRRARIEVVGKFLFQFAAESGVRLVSVDTDLLIDTVTRHEKSAKYGIRELIRLVERAIVDGMLDRRAEGFRDVAIAVEGDRIEVRGVKNSAHK